jgi:hypothetical protein
MRRISSSTRWFPFLVVGFLVVGLAAPAQAVDVTIKFNGTGSTPNGPATPFSGTFTYFQSHQALPFNSGNFSFTGSAQDHIISYQIGVGGNISLSGSECDPFVITNCVDAPLTFRLNAKRAATGDQIQIVIPNMASCSKNMLPVCTGFPTLPSTAAANKFVFTPKDGPVFTSSSMTLSTCSLAAAEVGMHPSAQCLPVAQFSYVPVAVPVVALTYVTTTTLPACPPRRTYCPAPSRGCCLKFLRCRR